MNNFFALPEDHEAKQKTKQKQNPEKGMQSGYVRKMNTTNYLSEDKTHPIDPASYYFIVNRGFDVFPDNQLFDLENKSVMLYKKMNLVAQNLMMLFGKAFSVESWVQENFICKEHVSAIKVSKYHVPDIDGCSTENEAKMRLLEHKDLGAMTFIYTGEAKGGLQLFVNGKYVDVPPMKDHLVLNVGLLFESATKGEVKAPNHRVRMPTVEELPESNRTSIAFFVNPKNETLLDPHNPDNTISWGKLVSDYVKITNVKTSATV